MRLVQDQQQRAFCLARLVQDLLEQSIFAHPRALAELADQQFQQPGAGQMRQVQIHRLPLRTFQLVQEPLQQRRLAHAAGTGHQTHRAMLGEVAQPRHALLHAVIRPERFGRCAFGEGLPSELEVS